METRGIVDEVIGDATVRSERIIATARALFAGLMLGHFLFYWIASPDENSALRAWVEVPVLSGAILFSVWQLRRLRGSVSTNLLLVSVTVDCLACFASLAPNALWPFPVYRGVFSIPDTAAILITVFGAGFRLSPRIALYGGLLNYLALIALVGIDEQVGKYLTTATWFVLFSLFFVAAVILAVLFAKRTRELTERGASEMLRAARAQENLGLLLSGHHDLRTRLSSANLSADLLQRRLAEGKQDPNMLQEKVDQLKIELGEINRFVANVKERSFSELAILQGQRSACVDEAVRVASEAIAVRFPEVALHGYPHRPDPEVVISGGAASLQRILLNLLVNACEGRDQDGASRIEVSTHEEDGMLSIAVEDDGPGFAEHLLESADLATSTKSDGAGLGLLTVSILVQASGGRLNLANRSEGGARVTVTLQDGGRAV